MGELLPYLGGGWFWWIVAAVLLIGELMLPGVFLIWLAGAAALTGLADLVFGLTWQIELAVFAVLSVLLVIASWNYVRKQHSPKSDQPDLNQRQTGYVGRRTIVLQAISNGSGKVKIEVNQTYALKDAAQAQADLVARKTTGSTILLP